MKSSYNTIIKTNNPIFKTMAKDINRHFKKENRQMINNHTEMCSISLINKEMQNKTIMKKVLHSH